MKDPRLQAAAISEIKTGLGILLSSSLIFGLSLKLINEYGIFKVFLIFSSLIGIVSIHDIIKGFIDYRKS